MSPASPTPPTWTTGALAALLKADLVGPADIALTSIDPITAAGPASLTFIRTTEYLRRWNASRAGAALVTRKLRTDPAFAGIETSSRALLLVDNADAALNQILKAITIEPSRPVGVSHLASVHAEATVHPTARIGAFVTVGPGAAIGAHTVIHDGCTIGARAKIGDHCELFPRVVIYDRCVLHNRVILHAGVVVGADGFGYIPAPDNSGLVKVPHAGIVEIHDDVEIGANSCVDRGKLGPTTIGAGTKIDNLCQIAHNVRIGRASIICGSSAIGGSCTIGDRVTLAGKVGVADNLTIGDGATVSAYSAVMRNIGPGETWGGNPAQPFTAYMRSVAGLSRLPEMMRQLKALSKPAPDS
ncbi:MAG: UDP-3-O-(3-hydroxymyristoyl)glucosamine N-acyltransferase [Phycisphaerales bacterium]|nr:UDP-3-O-(3-hydroxymyristoyl)glucosamine N-acyltransferase [Phycisphaerales bacterium]